MPVKIKKITGILVADQIRARLFTIARPQDPLKTVANLVNPKGRLHDRDMGSDRPGRTIDIMGMSRHAMSKQHSPTAQQAIRFAGLIGESLAEYMRQGAFHRLVLCAPPKQLGLIREALPEHVADCLLESLNKDLGSLDVSNIRAHLMKELPTIIQPTGPAAA